MIAKGYLSKLDLSNNESKLKYTVNVLIKGVQMLYNPIALLPLAAQLHLLINWGRHPPAVFLPLKKHLRGIYSRCCFFASAVDS